MQEQDTTPPCVVEGCEKPKRSRGYCSMHYERFRSRGAFVPVHMRVRRPKRPSWDDGFGHWLAGFTDGEGCFNISRSSGKGYVFTFGIMVRDDEAPTLYECQWRTGLGTIHFSPGRGGSNPQAKWEVRRKSDCFLLVCIFDTYPLRAKKARDYAIWREGVLHWQTMARTRTTQSNSDWTYVAELATALRAGRQYRPA